MFASVANILSLLPLVAFWGKTLSVNADTQVGYIFYM